MYLLFRRMLRMGNSNRFVLIIHTLIKLGDGMRAALEDDGRIQSRLHLIDSIRVESPSTPLEFLKSVNFSGQYFRDFLPWDPSIITTENPAGAAALISLLVFFSYTIVLNTVVPISLYVRFVAARDKRCGVERGARDHFVN